MSDSDEMLKKECAMVREIEVDTDVFAAIWSSREGSESTENQILRRLLLSGKEPSKVEGQEREHQVVTENTTAIEVKTSKRTSSEQSFGKENDMGKIRWVDDIRAVLEELGGSASLHEIYKAVEQRRRDGKRSLPRTLEAVVRRTLEDHSSDSANFRAADLFKLVGRGEWALRKTSL